MAKAFRKKYISLKEASVISGYTVPELKNFIKIGLIPSRKLKNKITVPFSAFEKIGGEPSSNKSKGQGTEPQHQELSIKPLTALVPFTTPNKHLVKVLESTALSAAMVMAFYVGTIPTVAEKVVFGIEITQSTIAYMANTAEGLIENSVAMPVTVLSRVASVSTYGGGNEAFAYSGQVAGIATTNEDSDIMEANYSSNDSDFVRLMNGIADASDSFERYLNSLGAATDELLIDNFTFDKLDAGLQEFFRL